MAKFGAKSKEQLKTCHQGWQDILNKAIEIYDFTVLEGYRGETRQNLLFKKGVSKLQYPNSYHNKVDDNAFPCSEAVDIAPFPLHWDSDREQFLILAGIIIGIGHTLGYVVVWGGDWDKDFDFYDQTFNDLAHFQIMNFNRN